MYPLLLMGKNVNLKIYRISNDNVSIILTFIILKERVSSFCGTTFHYFRKKIEIMMN